MTRIGKCHLCGVHTTLTYEHVPPRSAFNDQPVRTRLGRHVVEATSWEEVKNARSKKEPKGAGAYTLCGPCNNNTGDWYSRSYADWAYQALDLAEKAAVAPSLHFTFHIFPLRVIKQIACMFFSANDPEQFQPEHEDTVRFILNRERRYIDPRFRILAYFNCRSLDHV